jgi:hypothetical protein
MAVPQNHGTPGAHVVDIGVAVGIVYSGSGSLFDEHGIAPDGLECANGAVHASGDNLFCLLKQLRRAGVLHVYSSLKRVYFLPVNPDE